MSDTTRRPLRPTFRRFFVRGLAVLLPSILTLWLLVWAFQFVEGFIAEPINRSLRITIANASRIDGPLNRQFEPSVEDVDAEIARLRQFRRTEPRRDAVRANLLQRNVNQWWRERWWMDLIGFAVAITGVYMVGRFVGGYLGRRLHGRFEHLVASVPVLRYVYTSVKQVVDFLISDERPIQFSRVVAVEYPRRGIWSVGLLTGTVMPEMRKAGLVRPSATPPDRVGAEGGSGVLEDSVTIFIPSSPTPFTGYTITVPRRDVIELPISIDEALRFVVSGGVLRPGADGSAAPTIDLPSGTAGDSPPHSSSMASGLDPAPSGPSPESGERAEPPSAER